MPGLAKLFLALGGLFGALGVAFGAFGAHVLKGRLAPEAFAAYHTAAQYHLWHALALLAVGLLCAVMPAASSWLKAAGWLFAAGIVLFSGSLYLLAMTGIRWLGAVTPFGGIAFILGWLALALSALRA